MPRAAVEYHPLLRIAGEDPTASEVLAEALSNAALPVAGEISGNMHAPDPYQVDTSLDVELEQANLSDPAAGATYVGLTPAQRGAFLIWAQDPAQPAPPAFRRLLISHAEVALFDEDVPKTQVHRELLRWSLAPTWREDDWLERCVLLSLWLSASGDGIAQWTTTVSLSPPVLELAIGLQALLQEALRAEQARLLASAWQLPGAESPPDIIALRLRSLADSIGTPPLERVREQLSPDDLAPRPWRTAHRDLRFRVHQPVIRPLLQPYLSEMLSLAGDALDAEPVEASHAADQPVPEAARDWQLVLEFGHSRSEFYGIMVELARKMPGYLQILDEDKRLIHRVTFRKRELRTFWRMWDYVQNWSSTNVYLNGEELEHWKIWPYSQYLR